MAIPARGRSARSWTRSVLGPAVFLLAAGGMSEPCFAHGFGGSGWLHPLTGGDHMLAMVAVGAWSAQLGGRALYIVPSTFFAAMAVGGIAGFCHWPVPWTESIIAASVLSLGVVMASEARLAWVIAALATMLFGIAHGFAHGAEIPSAADKAVYVLGFLGTTAGLHVAGAVAGLLLLEQPRGRMGLRLAGTATALAGAILILGTFGVKGFV